MMLLAAPAIAAGQIHGAAALQPPGDSPHLQAGSLHFRADSQRNPEDAEAPQKIAESMAQRGKVPAEVMESTLLDRCRGRFLTAEELARLLKRTAPNIRSRYLTPMIRAGRLRLRFPEATNRPDQAYTAVEDPE